MVRIQRYQDFGIGRAYCATRTVGQIDTAVGNSHVVQNPLQFLRGNEAADGVFHAVAQCCGFFHPHARGTANMQTDLSGVDFGKQIGTQPWN